MSLNIDGEYDIRNINQKSFENEAKKLGLVDIQKQILKKAGIHNFKLTNP